MLIIIFQKKCNGKYDSVDLATTIVKRSFSKHLCLGRSESQKIVYFHTKYLQKDATGHSQKPNPRFLGGNITRGQRMSLTQPAHLKATDVVLVQEHRRHDDQYAVEVADS